MGEAYTVTCWGRSMVVWDGSRRMPWHIMLEPELLRKTNRRLTYCGSNLFSPIEIWRDRPQQAPPKTERFCPDCLQALVDHFEPTIDKEHQ